MTIKIPVRGNRLMTAGGLRMAKNLRTGSVEPSPYIPPGYTLVWADEFVSYNMEDWSTTVMGQVKWQPYWKAWNTRAIAGNSDDGSKCADFEKLGTPTGGQPYTVTQLFDSDGTYISKKTYGRYLHDITPQDTMIMRAYRTPPTWELPRYDDNPFWGYSYVASMLSTEMSHVHGYGYFEIRFRILNFFQGLHLSFWMLSKSEEWPPEIDILEVLGHARDKWYIAVHGDPAGSFGTILSSQNVTMDAGTGLVWATVPTYGDWHTLGFERTATTLSWILDGVAIRVNSNYLTPPNLPMYYLVTYEMAGTWEETAPGGPPPAGHGSPWPAEFEIEYVRIYNPP